MSKRVFVTGGTGFIGTALVRALSGRGDRAVVLTRDAERARESLGRDVDIVAGDPVEAGPWQRAVQKADAVVNLAGASLAGRRWDARYRHILRDSRTGTTRNVVAAIAATTPGQRPAVLASASGIDYYPLENELAEDGGSGPDDAVTEATPSGRTFLSALCREWEHEALAARVHGVRVVLLRTAVVLGEGGALARLATPFRLFVGGRVGSGKQWFSWVHIDDVVAGYLRAIDDDSLSGPVNLVAPGAIRNEEFSRALAGALGRPSWLPVPGFAVRAALGGMSEYVLHGRRAVPAALLSHGFDFKYPDIRAALASIEGHDSRTSRTDQPSI